MSHELRTPLNAILGFSEVMRAEMLGPHENPSYKEYAGNIHESGQHLLNLINEILDISPHRGRPLRAARGAARRSPTSSRTASGCCGCAPRARDCSIVEEFEPGLPQILGRRARHPPDLPQPACRTRIKFTPAGGTITLTRRTHARRRPVPERQGHRPRHPRGRDPARAAELRPGLAGASDRRRRHRARPAHHQGT